MNRHSSTAIAAVLLIAIGLCGDTYTARARAHRPKPHVKAVQSTAQASPIKSDIKVYLDGKEVDTVYRLTVHSPLRLSLTVNS